MESLKKYDKYIKGTLSEKEMDDFTKEIVREQFDEEKLVNKWNSILDKDEELQALKTAKSQPIEVSKALPASQPQPKVRRLGLILSVAASLLLLVGLVFFLTRSATPDYQQLAANELAQSFSVSSSRSSAEGEDKRLLANDFYRQGDYASAIPLYEDVIAETGLNNSDLFYLGLSELYLGNAELAIPQFKTLLESNDQHLKTESIWFLGLAYLTSDQLELAKVQLEFIANKGGWKSQAAKNLLTAMKK